ncbi:Crp/Fnr family transcriptional regulator [Dyadobacter luticola]|uniref:Crp/Fnr family transcriptional regulator n=1 Tax=Dyadobacter luticola TaxID=1979387 RepID=A0A5R9L6N9_9BACT|nr:Crp/Fnr family transcriptional regulator [Dyadobacter luticola]TLV03905.1 Crp/Fnr family transcriptional regulator [Dyadobacter luticola]
MLAEFEHYLKAQTGLPEETIRQVSSLATKHTLRRQEPILSPGQVCQHKAFIVKGLVRTFNLTADGNEHILQFSPENTWTLDVESYDKQVPSLVNISAIEQSQVLLWHKTDFDALLTAIPAFKQFSERLISRNIYYNRQRILTILGGTPEEKYEDFIRTFPTLLSRLPLHMIAGYLGMSVKTLTRIRHAQLQRS